MFDRTVRIPDTLTPDYFELNNYATMESGVDDWEIVMPVSFTNKKSGEAFILRLLQGYNSISGGIKIKFDTTNDETNGLDLLANSGEGFVYLGNMIVRISEGQRKMLKLNNAKFKLIGEDKLQC